MAFSTIKKTVLKVKTSLNSSNKKNVLNAIAELSGVDEVRLDNETKRIIVIGTVDPALLAEKVKKAGVVACIVSVGHPINPQEPLIDAQCSFSLCRRDMCFIL